MADLQSDSYYTICGDSVAEVTERGSRFIGYAYCVTSPEDAMEIVARLKKEHHSARHHCYAYRIGGGVEPVLERSSDDGEPSGTAGRPILGQLLSAEVSDVLVVVVRYFGGTLLGVPGLIAAYRGATVEVLGVSGKQLKVQMEWVRLEVDYRGVDRVMRVVKKRGLRCGEIEYLDSGCLVEVEVRLSERAEVLAEIL